MQRKMPPMTHDQKKMSLVPGIIETVDGLIPDPLMEELFMSVHTPAAYRFGGRSNPDDQFGFWLASIDSNVINAVIPFKRLWQTIDERITQGEYRIYHMIINANNFGDCPTVHSDIPKDKTDPEGYYTILYYANNEWTADWAGETVFFNPERDEIVRSIYPRPGRIAVFDSRIPHVSRTPSRGCTMVRYSIAIKVVRK